MSFDGLGEELDGSAAAEAAGLHDGQDAFREAAARLAVASDVQVTTATHTRRTGAFHIGMPVGGGLKNSAVRKLEPGAMARVVTDGKQVTELNIVFDDEDGTTIVAVPPKPAPKK